MTIERDTRIQFHEEGTLTAVTRWVGTHEEGIADTDESGHRFRS